MAVLFLASMHLLHNHTYVASFGAFSRQSCGGGGGGVQGSLRLRNSTTYFPASGAMPKYIKKIRIPFYISKLHWPMGTGPTGPCIPFRSKACVELCVGGYFSSGGAGHTALPVSTAWTLYDVRH